MWQSRFDARRWEHNPQQIWHSPIQPIPAKIILQPIEALANFVYSVRLTFAHRSNYAANNLVWLIKFASC